MSAPPSELVSPTRPSRVIARPSRLDRLRDSRLGRSLRQYGHDVLRKPEGIVPIERGAFTKVLILWAIARVVNFGMLWGFFIHADLRWRLGPLEWLVTTPAFHHWHHSRNDHINRNYAATLPVLDRVFGSHYLPRHWPAEVGTDTLLAPTLSRQLIEPLLPAPSVKPAAEQSF